MLSPLDQRNDKENTAPRIITQFTREMGVNLPPTYFTRILRETATIGESLVINHYSNKSTETEHFLYSNEIITHEYDKGENGGKGPLKHSSSGIYTNSEDINPEEKAPSPNLHKTLKELQAPSPTKNNEAIPSAIKQSKLIPSRE